MLGDQLTALVRSPDNITKGSPEG
ncbi:MAG: hypothetical protein QOH09_2167, partial [Pseudonocardiales bacterium]|nr:hypothetical protein [Pseudonocardiales bacterium]